MLTRPDGKLDVTRLSAIVDQIAWLRAHGYQVLLVSSGATASGRGEMKASRKLDSVAQRQLYSALGQVKLVGLYYSLFREYGIHIGQVLTMKENFASRHLYLNQRECMEVMLENGVLPIINENDTVSVTELMFTDNDELSGLVATMMGAHRLIILSNIDGIYDGAPTNPDAHIIATVEPGRDLSEYIQQEKSDFGRGGMITKCRIARKVAEEGVEVIIANGKRDRVLCDLIEHPEAVPHTTFVPNADAASGVKKWIAHSESFAKGVVKVNAKAAEALTGERAVSLLMVGVTAIEGEFEEGDIVNVSSPDGRRIAVGRSSYASDEARACIGRHGVKPIIHYDYLCTENI